jgi:hypothetical protein
LNDKAFMNNTLVMVTFDENHTYGKQNRVVGILLGDAVPAQLVGTTDDTFYNHYSEIATVHRAGKLGSAHFGSLGCWGQRLQICGGKDGRQCPRMVWQGPAQQDVLQRELCW